VTPLEELHQAVTDASRDIGPGDRPRATPTLERSRRSDFGDYSTNAALLLAPVVGEPPRAVAERLRDALAGRLAGRLARVEVAGPGFLNLFLDDSWFYDALGRVLADEDRFGAGGARSAERINIEFVSANPTGPLTVAHGRHIAYGDALARILIFHGHQVQREFYVNDYGTQVVRLAESIRARALGQPLPPDGYQGDYVTALVAPQRARELDLDALGREAVSACLDMIRATLERFGVTFDEWFSERRLHEGDPNRVRLALDELERQGELYRHEGALWLRTSAHGDDKDRVLVRSTGEHTYFASDVAYHQDKLARGFERLIDVWGADHHGYVARMRAAFEALGGSPDALELIILQFVHLMEGGGRASMSKRRGEYVSLDELIEEIGADAARYFLLARSHDTTVDLDLDLARAQRADNPVYYVQYAHARIASVLDRAGEAHVQAALSLLKPGGKADPPRDVGAPALEPAERSLLKRIVAWPGEVSEAADRRAPHRISTYALELAQEFTAFYRDCRIVGAEPRALESRRIAIAVAAQRTVARSLDLLGVSAPERM